MFFAKYPGIRLDQFTAAISARKLCICGDYSAEVFLPFPTEQYEAAKVLKITPVRTIRLIIFAAGCKCATSVFNRVMTLVKGHLFGFML